MISNISRDIVCQHLKAIGRTILLKENQSFNSGYYISYLVSGKQFLKVWQLILKNFK